MHELKHLFYVSLKHRIEMAIVKQGELTLNLMRTRVNDNDMSPNAQIVHITNNPQEAGSYFPHVSKLS